MEINLKTDSEIFLTDDYEIFAKDVGKPSDMIRIGIGDKDMYSIVSKTGVIHFFIPEDTVAEEITFENLTRTVPTKTVTIVRPMTRMVMMAAEPETTKVINYFTVDEPTRRITVPEEEKVIGAQFENEAEEKWFKIPRFVDNGLDLSQTTISIVYKNANKLKHEVGETEAQNVVATENEVTFKWVVPGGATNYEGEILFLVKATKAATKAIVWSTTVAKGIVEKGLNTDNLVPEPADKETVMLLLEKIKAEGNKQVDRVTGAGGGTGGTTDYTGLTNKPQINGHELNENQTAEQLGLQPKGNYLTQHQDISGKADKTEIPTKTSQLTNDSGYQTKAQVEELIKNGGGTIIPPTPQPIDTTPVIEYANNVWSTGKLNQYEGAGVTKIYKTPKPVQGDYKIKLDYDIPKCGNILKPQGQIGLFNDNLYITYWAQTQAFNRILDDTYGAFNGIRFNIPNSEIDNSYAIDRISGHIFFAGKNTMYYGMDNINSPKALSIDNDIAQNYNLPYTGTKDIPPTTLPDAYVQSIEQAKKEWMLYCNGDVNKIPIIIHTDQHSKLDADFYKYIGDSTNYYEMSKVINLGDTADTWFNNTENPLSTTNILDKYLEYTYKIPFSKRIEVFGNHDTWRFVDGSAEGITPQNYLYKYFRNVNAKRFDNYGNFVVQDDYYNVKYVVVAGFAYDSGKGGYSHYIIPSDSIDMIIKELEKVDGYDVIILSHNPLADVRCENIIDPTTGGQPQYASQSVNFKKLDDLWIARKNKTTGTVVDEYGVSHSFDFTKCNGELLCGLHGHQHEDGYYYLGDVLLDAFFDAYYISPKAFFFVVVDKTNELLNIWKVEDTPKVQNYQIPFNKTII